jgi:hypothetical protein
VDVGAAAGRVAVVAAGGGAAVTVAVAVGATGVTGPAGDAAADPEADEVTVTVRLAAG